MDLADKVALVTGAARRVGRAIALELARAGARVVIHYRSSEADARSLADEIEGDRAGAAFLQQADLSDPLAIQRMVRNVEVDFGYVDLLVNNASEFFETPLLTASDADWDRLMTANLRAPFQLCRRVAAPMLNRGGGCIINVTDVYAERPLARHLVYSVSKAGLVMLTRGLARELAPTVRVNAVAPGSVLWPEDYPEERRARLRKRIPLGREGTPEDVARAVRFLTAEDYVTGEVLHVDGGKSLS